MAKRKTPRKKITVDAAKAAIADGFTKEQLSKSCACYSAFSHLSLSGAHKAANHFFEQKEGPLSAEARAEIETLSRGIKFSPIPGVTVSAGIPAPLATALLSEDPIAAVMAMPQEAWRHTSSGDESTAVDPRGFSLGVTFEEEFLPD